MTRKTPSPRAQTTPSSLSRSVANQAKEDVLAPRGYKNPPPEHQFKKGQSGNPKGRPRKASKRSGPNTTNSAFLEQAERQVTIREGENTRQVDALEAVMQAQFASACKGNALAQKEIINRHERATEERRRELQTEIEGWEHYIAKERARIDAAERLGRPPPHPFPHPDDVVIDREHGVRFAGPVDEASLARVEQSCRMRDVLLMQDALDCRSWPESSSDDPLDGPGTALLFAGILNDSVPERFRLSNGDLFWQMLRFESTPKRQLLKDVYRGWLSLGAHPSRGRLFPPMRFGKQLVDIVDAVLQRLQDGSLDADESTLEDYVDLVASCLDELPAHSDNPVPP